MSRLLSRGGAILAIALAMFIGGESAEAGHCYNGVCYTSGPTYYPPVYTTCRTNTCYPTYQHCYPVEVRVKDWHKRCNYRRIEVRYKHTKRGLIIEYDYDD